MKSFISRMLFVLLGLGFVFSCSDTDNIDDDDDDDDTEVPVLTQKVNDFVVTYVEDAYLWNQLVPSNIDISKEPDPDALFERLLNKNLDKWSYLTDDADAMFSEYEGISTTYGYRLTVYQYNKAGDCYAVVRFVYPDSPAEKAGIERGDVILLMNSGGITTDNYLQLHYSSTITLQMGKVVGYEISLAEKKATMQAVEMYLDPINEHRIITKGNHKIGYLCYTDYVEGSHDKLLEVFGDFKRSGVTDIVLDLRYNPGGAVPTTKFLCSILAPASAVNNESVFLQELWNDDYMAYFKSKGEDTNEYFLKDIGVNMDLDHIYILTSENTASASEATIVGLRSYIDVIQIGETTHGKYCGAALLQPTNSKGQVIKEIENWAMSLVIYKFANKDGYTDFVNGLTPDVLFEDNWTAYYPLGDERDPALAKAISIITGQPVPTARSTVSLPHTPLPDWKQPDARRGGMIKPISAFSNAADYK